MLQKLWRWTKLFLGWSWVSITALGGIGIMSDMSSGKNTPGGVFVFLAMFGAGGVALLRSAYKSRPQIAGTEARATQQSVSGQWDGPPRPSSAPSLDDEILACAEKHEGKLTITDCASDLGLTFGAARDALEKLVKAGVCTSEMLDNRVFYDFSATMRKRGVAIPQRY